MKQTNKEYAKALFMLACEENSLDKYSECMSQIRSVTDENPGYTELLSTPAILLSERLAAIDAAFSGHMPDNIVSFLKLLCENGHISELSECIEEFFELERQASNRITATVYSVVALDDEQKKALEAKLEKLHGKSVDAVYIEDKTLIGGIKVEIEDKVLYGSIEKRLQKVKEVINS